MAAAAMPRETWPRGACTLLGGLCVVVRVPACRPHLRNRDTTTLRSSQFIRTDQTQNSGHDSHADARTRRPPPWPVHVR
eukprot:716028-Prymnesium_polylepis.1